MMADDLGSSSFREELLKTMPKLEEGDLIEGVIVDVRGSKVIVDVGLKSEGVLDRVEFDEEPKIGEKVLLKLIKRETADGSILVSKRQADWVYFRKVLEDAFQNKKPVKGRIVSVVKGGYQVDLGYGYSGFLPQSKASLEKIKDPNDLLGIKDEFLIEKLELGKRPNIVLNRSEYHKKLIEQKREEFFNTVKKGDIVEGVVKNFTSYGAFIDLGGFDGLLHRKDMSWGHVNSPKNFVEEGQKLKLIVWEIDREKKRINLSLKHFHEDPWASFEERFKLGDVVEGTVTKLTEYGAFVQIAPEIEGLVHISEFSWVRRVKKPEEMVKIGDTVNVKIIHYNVAEGRVSLSIKQARENPWEQIEELFPIGKVVKAKVLSFTARGVMVDLGGEILGSLAAEDISWTKKVKNPRSELTEGQIIDVKILDHNHENYLVQVGMKQVTEDPWMALKTHYPKGSLIEGEVSGKADFGIFVRVTGGIEGLIPKSYLTDKKDENPDEIKEKFQVGDKITAIVHEILPEKLRLTLSLRNLDRRKEKEREKDDLSRFLHQDDDEQAYRLGDVLKRS